MCQEQTPILKKSSIPFAIVAIMPQPQQRAIDYALSQEALLGLDIFGPELFCCLHLDSPQAFVLQRLVYCLNNLRKCNKQVLKVEQP